MVYLVQNKEDLDKKITEAGNKLIVIDFFANWCGPCKIIAPKLEELSALYIEQALMLKVDVDECEEIALDYNITSMPTFVFMKNNQIIDVFVGGNSEKLVKSIEKYVIGGPITVRLDNTNTIDEPTAVPTDTVSVSTSSTGLIVHQPTIPGHGSNTSRQSTGSRGSGNRPTITNQSSQTSRGSVGRQASHSSRGSNTNRIANSQEHKHNANARADNDADAESDASVTSGVVGAKVTAGARAGGGAAAGVSGSGAAIANNNQSGRSSTHQRTDTKSEHTSEQAK